MPGSHTFVVEYSAQNERFGFHGILEREKQSDDISEVWEHEVRIPKSRILVQRVLRGYSRKEYCCNKNIHRESAEE